MDYEENLEKLKLKLPPPPSPAGAYVPFTRCGNIVFLSGILPKDGGDLKFKGKVGNEVSVEEGREATRLCALNALSIIKNNFSNLNKVKRVLRLIGYINSDDNFFDQPKVLNAASELFLDVFGKEGRHARTAIGVNSLPANSVCELELTVEVSE